MNHTNTDKQWFKKILETKNLVQKIKNIKLVITDIDGCLTNGTINIGDSQHPNDKDFSRHIAKNFSTQDGFAITQSIKNNHLLIAFLTGRTDEATKIRAKMLGIPNEFCFIGINSKKIEKVKTLQTNNKITKEQTLYFGDDFLDFQTIPAVEIMSCPQNTPFYFQNNANIIIPRDGGNDGIRLLLDLILYIQQKHFAQDFINNSL